MADVTPTQGLPTYRNTTTAQAPAPVAPAPSSGTGVLARMFGPSATQAATDTGAAIGQGNYGAALGDAVRTGLMGAANVVNAPLRAIAATGPALVAPVAGGLLGTNPGTTAPAPTQVAPGSTVNPATGLLEPPTAEATARIAASGVHPVTEAVLGPGYPPGHDHVTAVDHATGVTAPPAGYTRADWVRQTAGLNGVQWQRLMAMAPPILSPRDQAMQQILNSANDSAALKKKTNLVNFNDPKHAMFQNVTALADANQLVEDQRMKDLGVFVSPQAQTLAAMEGRSPVGGMTAPPRD